MTVIRRKSPPTLQEKKEITPYLWVKPEPGQEANTSLSDNMKLSLLYSQDKKQQSFAHVQTQTGTFTSA